MNLDNQKALELWRNVTIAGVASDMTDLTSRQTAVLMLVSSATQEEPQTVRRLAATLNIGKPAVTRALDTLTKYSFIERRRDEKDRRSVFVRVRDAGQNYLDRLSDTIINTASKASAAA